MEIKIGDKTYKVAWEYIIAPLLLLLAIAVLVITNFSSIKREIIGVSDNSERVQGHSTSPEASQSVIVSENTHKNDTTSDKSADASEEPAENETKSTGLVNINKASMEELISLPYIGEVKAKAIIDYRTKYGPFKSVDELINIKGIGPKTLEKLRPFVTVE